MQQPQIDYNHKKFGLNFESFSSFFKTKTYIEFTLNRIKQEIAIKATAGMPLTKPAKTSTTTPATSTKTNCKSLKSSATSATSKVAAAAAQATTSTTTTTTTTTTTLISKQSETVEAADEKQTMQKQNQQLLHTSSNNCYKTSSNNTTPASVVCNPTILTEMNSSSTSLTNTDTTKDLSCKTAAVTTPTLAVFNSTNNNSRSSSSDKANNNNNPVSINTTTTTSATTNNTTTTATTTTELLRCNMAKIASNFLNVIISSYSKSSDNNNSSGSNRNNNNNNSSDNNKNLQQQHQQFISFTSRKPMRKVAATSFQNASRHSRRSSSSSSSTLASSFDCLFVVAIFSLIFLMVEKFQIVSATSTLMTKREPMFISRSETFKFVSGETIVLPCEVENTDTYVVAWKRGIAILTAGSVKVTPDPRVRLVNGFNLQIRDAVPQDAGDYICQIATMEPREITHTVEILVPPRIHHISTGGHLQVKKGSSVRIECSASGNPTPNVTWSRKNNILPNGEEKLHSHILSIENVDRHKGGVYICTANNGVGQPASSQVVLHVLYPPEISVERPVVFSGEGHEAMLVCIVHGETLPEVIWFKDTMQLDTTERHIMETRGSRHTLIIRKVHPQDFGNYSCVAENQLGKSRKTLQLSGKPNVAVFNSPPISQYKDRYNISWTVDSHTPIEEYKLSFRRMPQGHEVDNTIDHSSSSSSSSSSATLLQMYGSSTGSGSSFLGNNHNNHHITGVGGGGGTGLMSTGYANVLHWGRNDWRNVVLPSIPLSHHYTQGMSYMIRGLDPDQHYEATVQARNRYGWSDLTHNFVFSTSSNDSEMRDLSVTFYGSGTTKTYFSSSLLIGFTMIIIRFPKIFLT